MDNQQLAVKVRELMNTACTLSVRGEAKHRNFHSARMDAFQEVLCYLDPAFRESLGITTEEGIKDIFGGDPE